MKEEMIIDSQKNPTYWCSKCNVPLIQEKCERCGKQGSILSKSLRPVYKAELDILREQCKSKSKWLSLPDLSLWKANRTYFYNSKKVFSVKEAANEESLSIKFYDNKSLPEELLKTEIIIERLKEANKSSLNRLEYQAIEFIKQAIEMFPERLPVVSFSGGKDSCVVSHLVRLALGSKILHIFGDTTIEYPDTYKFIEKFQKNNPTVPFLTVKPRDFFELAEEIGPPSRILRWCCTTQKITPIGNLMASLNKKGVLTFDGIRNSESSRRRKYDVVSLKSKIAHQVLVHPIFLWNDTEIWCYIITRGIDINLAYKYGFTRVGCLYCPFQSQWSCFISQYRYKEEFNRWQSFLHKFTEMSKVQEPDSFINKNWKVRAHGMGYKSNLVSVRKYECEVEENTIRYDLNVKVNDSLLEYFKPFGKIVKYADTESRMNFFILNSRTNETLLMLQLSKKDNSIKIAFLAKNGIKLLAQRVEKQVLRFQTCVLCGQCHNTCKVGAFSPIQSGSYSINENICVNCLECVKKECVAYRSLKDNRKIKKGNKDV